MTDDHVTNNRTPDDPVTGAHPDAGQPTGGPTTGGPTAGGPTTGVDEVGDTPADAGSAVGPADAGPGYPRHWEADVVASDGGIVHLRPITPSDGKALLEFHARLSERTRYLRFFGPYPRIPNRDLVRFTTVDHRRRVAFIGLLGDEIVAVGRYEGLGDGEHAGSAEVAFVVRDDHQGRGLGSILLEHLAAAARENGLRRFEAEVLVENHQMVRVFRDAGYQISRAYDGGVVHLEWDIDPTERSLAVRDSREQAAEARSVHNLLHPRSVAVIGASTDPSKIGHAVLRNLLDGNFTGPVYPVNSGSAARSVRGVRAYASVTEIPDDVDLAVVAVPAAGIDEVLDSCLAKGVKALIVVSSGFADAGSDGSGAERRMVEAARAHGMRVVGPNALGVANTAAGVRLNATLAPRLPGVGRVGFFSQSGALGIALLDAAAERGLGLSTFVSAGNRADVSGNDLLQYWQTDPDTDVVLLYLETFGNPRKFGRVARRLARTTPIVAVKSGRRVGALGRSQAVPIDDSSVEALFEQSGVIRVATVSQMFDTALLLAYQPLPAGPRIAVVGNSTALGVLVTDGLLDQGLELAGDAVDVGAGASPEQFAAAVREAVASEAVDALVAVFVPPVAMHGAPYARALREAVAGSGKPVVTTFLAAEGVPAELTVRTDDDTGPGPGSVPSYPSPERAVAALGRVVQYARWRATPLGEFVTPEGTRSDDARDLVARLVAADGGRLSGPTPLTDSDAAALLSCYGIEIAAFRTADGVDAAVAAAAELGHPVVLKAAAPRWRHRPDLVGVRLGLDDADAVAHAYRSLTAETGSGDVYVQVAVARGISCVLEVVDDPSFGSLLSFGLSGLATELLGDRAYRVVPVSTADAAALVRAPRAAPLLAGYRGDPPVRLAALEELVLRLGSLAEQLPEVRSVVLDPVIASPDGAAVTGARVVLGPPPTRDDGGGPRRLW